MKKKWMNGNDPLRQSFQKLFLIMRLSVVIILGCFLHVSASTYSQNVRLSIYLKDASIKELFKDIKKQSEFSFVYNIDDIEELGNINCTFSKANVDDILTYCLKGTSMTYEIRDKVIIIVPREDEKLPLKNNSPSEQTKKITISGKIKDKNGEPLPGVSILIKGTTLGITSDIDGNYTLQVPDSKTVLLFSFIGMRSQEIEVNGKTTIDVVMYEETIGVDEVVVTALGIKREEKALGYAVQKIAAEDIQKTKGSYVATALTGKVSGLWVQNSTEFNTSPTLLLRGESPLLVIDGVPYSNMSLTDIAADNIESVDVLKGGTASALYGYRGSSGAVIVTTKKGMEGEKGVTIQVNSNTMFAAGFLATPEVQSSYGHGLNGELADDYVWGPKLDIGLTAEQWNPLTKEYEDMPLISSGKDNFKNFLEPSIISNNTVSISQSGENGSFRVALNHIYDKGQYPNLKKHTVNFSAGGQMKIGDKFDLDANIGFNRQMAPQTVGSGYGSQGYMYQLLLWSGPDYDVRQYRDYWLVKDEQQNWLYNAWYDNPYLIAYEKLKGQWTNKLNASTTINYKLTPDLKLIARSGYDLYINEYTIRNPQGVNSTRGGFYADGVYTNEVVSGYSINSDAMLTFDKKVGSLEINALGGGTIYRYTDKDLYTSTSNGLVVPGYYSLSNSVDAVVASSTIRRRQVNSLFGKLSLSYIDAIFVDVTGRNDWSSTQSKSTRSFFYPSVASSILLSEFFNKPSWMDLLKVRSSWTISKAPLGIYDNNQAYTTGTANWNELLYAKYPDELVSSNVSAEASRTIELGTNIAILRRLKFDFAYYNKLYYNQQESAGISKASGFETTLVNTDEETVRRGYEITVDATVVKHNNFQYNLIANWSVSHKYYHKLDPIYSEDALWIKKGKRTDTYTDTYWLRDPDGNIIHKSNGMPWESDYEKLYGYTDPKFIWGLSNNFKWKRFNATINFDGRVGGLMYNYTEYKMWDTGSHPDTDNEWRYDEVVNGNTSYVGNGVKVTSGSVTYDSYGQITSDTREYAENDTKVSYQSYARELGSGNMGIVSGTFLKLRDFSLGYDLPSQVASKIGAKKFTVALTGQNVFLWTKEMKYADPDSDDDTDLTSPSNRYIGMNINLTF